ncbi:coiled-coil domain-containing protein 152-like [Pristis pectinata]|uniref:coiled-coil domain-containing protein 152-like n=1 Tax=Pristis pectinata TaxID=685728 RepID=UPI00223C8F98|nr:coiled-coil domain-containing protein 152-like [Pristis pectinata]
MEKMKKATHAANLDKLVEDFALLEQKICEIQGRNSLLEIQLEEANRLVKLTQTKENCLKEECVVLHRMMEELQGTIQNQYDVRDENENLKRRIRVLEEKLKMVEQEEKRHVERLLLQVKTREQEQEAERAEIQQNLNRQFEIKEAELNRIIDKKETEIQLLNRQICSQEREKQREIIKLQMEFNTKLVKIQSTSLKSPHHDLSGLPHNIFKRKLQHLQEEKNQEIAALRRTIRELEQQRDCNHTLQLKRRKF